MTFSLGIQNLLTIGSIRIESPAHLTVLAGPNGHGKTAICDAIELCMLGKPIRVKAKKDLVEVVRKGQKSGAVQMSLPDGRDWHVTLPKGEFKAGAPDGNPYLPLTLNPHAIASLDPLELRKTLQRIAGVTMTGDAVLARLRARGRTEASVAAITGDLRLGFETAAKKADSLVVQARASWKATTGEVYGSEKAVGWQAHRPEPVSDHDHEADANKARGMIEKLTADLSALVPSDAKARGQTADNLRSTAALQTMHENMLAQFEAERDALAAKVEDLRARAGGDQGTRIPCPCCKEPLLLAAGKLTKATGNQADPVAFRDLQEALTRQGEVASLIVKHETALTRAKTAGETLKTLEQDVAQVDPAKVRELEESIAGWRKELREAESIVKAKGEYARQIADADRKEREAAKYHADLVEFSALRDDLEPDGIPGELSAEVLAKINPELAAMSAEAGFDVVAIDQGFRLTYAGHPYYLLSLSQQWRACAVMGAAIARQQKTGILILDEFCVLSPNDRGAALGWLLDLAPVIGNIIVAGTFASVPTIPDAHVVSLFPVDSVAVVGVTA